MWIAHLHNFFFKKSLNILVFYSQRSVYVQSTLQSTLKTLMNHTVYVKYIIRIEFIKLFNLFNVDCAIHKGF